MRFLTIAFHPAISAASTTINYRVPGTSAQSAAALRLQETDVTERLSHFPGRPAEHAGQEFERVHPVTHPGAAQQETVYRGRGRTRGRLRRRHKKVRTSTVARPRKRLRGMT
ncbi:MAG: hypothetical protein WBW60_09505, partial [Candidatus Sulfotelmatobacter sp.]